MARFELEEDEVRPTLNLSPEEIAALEAEKREMAGLASATRKSDRGRIRGHGTALDEPTAINAVRKPEAVRVLAAVERMNGEIGEDLDPEVLGALAKEAKDREAEFRLARDAYESASVASVNARVRLNDYMREHGLA